jgi:hypothetical protein
VEKQREVPWWLTTRARLSVLIACLALTVLALTTSRTSVFSGGGSARAAGTCPGQVLPELRTVSDGGLAGLRARLLPLARVLGGRSSAAGIVPPVVPWTDYPPASLASAREAGDHFPGAYELRQRDRDSDEIVSDVFLFSGPGDARRFFAKASSGGCRQQAAAAAASSPSGARNLSWRNPDGLAEQDVFLLAGPAVYRISAVHPQGARPPSPSDGLPTLDRLACILPGVRCAPAPA